MAHLKLGLSNINAKSTSEQRQDLEKNRRYQKNLENNAKAAGAAQRMSALLIPDGRHLEVSRKQSLVEPIVL
jgi:hypothetical protein